MTSVPHPRAGTLPVVVVALMGLGGSLFGVGCPTQLGASRSITPPEPIPSSTFPIILTPTTDQTVTAGASIPVTYQIANPIAEVIVSAYLERTDVGTQVATRSNLSTTGQTVELSTAGLAPGTYYPTVSLDNGISRSVARAKTAGDEDVAIQVRSGGTITFLAPTTSGPFAVGEEISVSFVMDNATVPTEYRVFYDSDGVLNGNESPISVGRGTKANVVWRTAGLLPGVYFIGVTAESTGRSTTEYADTHIRLTEVPPALVTAPDLGQIIGGNPPALTSGRDTGVRWLGQVGQQQGIAGARIMGTAAGDQLGNMVRGVGDQNGDSRDDYLISARLGGGGAGEAILSYGSTRRTVVGTDVRWADLGGVTFAGIPGGASEGLTDVVPLPDVDGDGAEEFVFAFPHVFGTAPDIMAAPGHFNAGGLVVVSSRNSALAGSGGFLGRGSISLNNVGRNFNCEDGKPCLGRDGPKTCNVLWTPSTNPSGDCFSPPLTLVDCNPDERPAACPCVSPGVFPGMWPGGEVGDGFSEDDLQQGQLEPYGARILGTQTSPLTLVIDCDNDGEEDALASYLRNSQRFDDAGRFGSVLGMSGTSAFGDTGSLVVADPTAGNSGTIYRISSKNWWKSRLETSDGSCIWGTPKPFSENPDFPAPCVDVMDFSVPRPHQYLMGDRGVSFSTLTGPAGSKLGTFTEWRVDNDALVDIVVGAPGYDEDDEGDEDNGEGGEDEDNGAIYVLLGKDLGGSVNVDAVFADNASPLGSETIRGTKIIGGNGEHLGEVQPQVGDFDGDNHPDLLVGIPRFCDRDATGVCEEEEVGAVLVIFGGLDLDGNGRLDLVERLDPRTNPWTIPELLQANLAILFKGERDGDEAGLGCPTVGVDHRFWAGYAIASPGDVDGDFLDDIMVSAPGADHDFATVLMEEATAGVRSIFVASDEGITVGAEIHISTPALPEGFECRTVQAINRLPKAQTDPTVFQLKLKNPLTFDHQLVEGQQEIAVRLIDAGKVFVLYGRPDLRMPVGLDTDVFQDRVYAMTDAASLKLGSTIYVGRQSNSYAGGREALDPPGLGSRKFFTAAGDVDSDGAIDLLIGAPAASPFNRDKAGEVYLIYTGP